jgi:hypothetical protein
MILACSLSSTTPTTCPCTCLNGKRILEIEAAAGGRTRRQRLTVGSRDPRAIAQLGITPLPYLEQSLNLKP